MKICCFTGHRTLSPDAARALTALLDHTLEKLAADGFTIFRTGGARGFDTLAALRVLALRERHPHCQLHLILPCRDQSRLWNARERALYERIIQEANSVHVLQESYTPECMYARNRALVDGSDLCIAFLKENRGGTLYTCSYALRKGVRLCNLSDELKPFKTQK